MVLQALELMLLGGVSYRSPTHSARMGADTRRKSQDAEDFRKVQKIVLTLLNSEIIIDIYDFNECGFCELYLLR